MARLSEQVETTAITFKDMLAHESFADGYGEIAAKKPFNTDYPDIAPSSAWLYERGRMLAIGSQTKWRRILPLWVETEDGPAISLKLLNLARDLFYERAMV